MVHFLFYAGKAYWNAILEIENPIGEAVQVGYQQEALDGEKTGYSYEDLPSDKFRAEFAAMYFDPKSRLTLAEQIRSYLVNLLKVTDPNRASNYQKLPEKDSDAPPSRTNTTTPVYTTENP